VGASAAISVAVGPGPPAPTRRRRGRPKDPLSRRSRRDARGIGVTLDGKPGKGWRCGRRTNKVCDALVVEDAIKAGRELSGKRDLGDKPALRAFMQADLCDMAGRRTILHPDFSGVVKRFPRLQSPDVNRRQCYERLFPCGYSDALATAIITKNLARLVMLVRRYREAKTSR